MYKVYVVVKDLFLIGVKNVETVRKRSVRKEYISYLHTFIYKAKENFTNKCSSFSENDMVHVYKK